MTERFDAIVIGTGQAGPSLAVRFAKTGRKTAIIERHLFGGTCVNTPGSLAGLALVLFLAIASFKVNTTSDPLNHLAEVESLSEHVSSFSFRSHSHNMFVVWLHENTEQQASADMEPELDDEILQ